jgi:hypothetical protein
LLIAIYSSDFAFQVLFTLIFANSEALDHTRNIESSSCNPRWLFQTSLSLLHSQPAVNSTDQITSAIDVASNTAE